MTGDIDDIRDYIEYIDDKYDARIAETVTPRIDQLEAERDDARSDRAELFDLVEDLQQRVAVLEERLDGIAGLAEDQQSSPDKRVIDLRQAMIRRAEAREERDEFPGVKLWWKQVRSLFEDYGHGTISKPDCYKAMREAADHPGFDEATKVNPNGNEVKAIRLNLDDLRAHAESSDPTTPEGASDTNQTAGKTVQPQTD